jgi:penicillin G amidase
LRYSLFFSAPLFAALVYAGARPIGRLPALGPLLEPAHGIWASARGTEFPDHALARIPGLRDSVRVVYDDRGVPHIFASSEGDLFRALGFVVARDRLFQMELQTRATAGTLTELVGRAALRQDVRSRRLGLAWGAEQRFAALDPRGETIDALRAYADGVNALIQSLGTAGVPLEHKLLGSRPMAWDPVYSLYLLSRMSLTLAYDEDELRLARVQALVGQAAAESVFPVNSSIRQPIQPYGSGVSVVPSGIAPPGAADSSALESASAIARVLDDLRVRNGELAVGSNNWAVAPSRSATGHALLAGDPHLELTLPSIWYEVHLVIPGRLDVYGVTIPGAPIVTIGFNRDIAWTFTNTGADVVDLYHETVDDSIAPGNYLLDGRWHPVSRTVEVFRDRSGAELSRDTLYRTHRGPLRSEGGRWLSMHWTALDTIGTAGQLGTFAAAAKARSVDEFFAGSANYPVPAQNMIVADRSGNIGIRSTGRYPIRPGNGLGTVVRDGSSRSSDWVGNLPLERYPQAINPAQGFLVSANQQPVDPRDNPAYLGSNWPAPWRALRINALLAGDSGHTLESMRAIQTDAGSARVDAILPAMLDAASSPMADADSREAARLLRDWNRSYRSNDNRAVLFERVMSQLNAKLWDELVPPDDTSGRRVASPSTEMIAVLLMDSTNGWWDVRGTPAVERRDEILRAAMAAGLRDARARWGEPGDERWLWGKASPRNIYHLLRIPSFSETGLSADGGPSTISPRDDDGTHGASWRMIVELGPVPSARVIYPGGQSGNPVSARYADRIPRWLRGELDTPLVPTTASDIPGGRISSTLTILPRVNR